MNHHKSVGPNLTTFKDMLMSAHLELHLHAGDILSWFDLRQPLDVGVQVPGRDLRVPAGHGLQQCVMNEDVLILRLDHVVPLGAHQRDMAVDVEGLLMLDPLGHAVDYYEATCATHSSTEPKRGREKNREHMVMLYSQQPMGDTLLVICLQIRSKSSPVAYCKSNNILCLNLLSITKMPASNISNKGCKN